MAIKNGRLFLIYIDTVTAITATNGSGASYKAVAALKSNGFGLSVSSIDTTTKDTAGWQDSEPGDGSFEISGEANAIDLSGGDTRKNYAALIELAIEKTKFWAKIADVDGELIREGVVYISKYDESFPDNEATSFSVTFTGCGKPLIETV